MIDAALIAALVVAAAWLGRLVYHNHFGGHTPNPLDAAADATLTTGSATAATENASATPAKGGPPGATDAAPATPARRYEVLNVYPHDPGAYTQGLLWHDGALYEGTGRNGQSSLRRVELETGRVLAKVDLPWELFGEGIAVFGDRIFQLTWLSNTGLIYDVESLAEVGRFRYETEGWGLTADDRHLIMSDGSESLYFLDPRSGERVRTLRVFDENGGVEDLNELELIKGFIWANVWHSDDILKIDPDTGEVLDRVDFSGLLGGIQLRDPEAVFNGIAYDGDNDRLFLTGKLWPRMFEVRLIEDET